MTKIQFTTVHAGGRVLHTQPEGNTHTRCGIVSENTVDLMDGYKAVTAGTKTLCKNCARVVAPRDLNAGRKTTNTWIVTNRAGQEVTRVVSPTSLGATALIRRDAVCRELFELEGRVSKRRLYAGQH